MRTFLRKVYGFQLGTLQLRIVLSPKAFLVTAAIISALALTPNFKRGGITEVPEPPAHAAIDTGAPRTLPSPLSAKSPGGTPPGINDLLYLEDFGTNLYTIDSMTGAASLAPVGSAGVSPYGFARTANNPGPTPTESRVAPEVIPTMRGRGFGARVSKRSSGRTAGLGGPSGGDFAAAHQGSAPPGRASSRGPDEDLPPPLPGSPDPNEGARGFPDSATPAPARFGQVEWYFSSSISPAETSGLSPREWHSLLIAPAHAVSVVPGAVPNGPPVDEPMEFPHASPYLLTTVFTSTQLSVFTSDTTTVDDEITLESQARDSFDSSSPVPEPGGTLLVAAAMMLIMLGWGPSCDVSTFRYNTGQKRPHIVSEAQPNAQDPDPLHRPPCRSGIWPERSPGRYG